MTSGHLDHARYIDVAQQLTGRFKFKAVAITLRESFSASRNGWSGLLYAGGKPHFSRRYEIDIGVTRNWIAFQCPAFWPRRPVLPPEPDRRPYHRLELRR